MIAPQDAVQSTVETLDHGVTLEWIEDRQILVYRLPDTSQQALDALFVRAENIVREWPAGTAHLVIIDFASAGVMPTAYVRERGRAIWTLRTDILVVTAMLMARTVAAQFLKVVTARTQNPKALMAVHFTREEAVEWLKKVSGID